MNLAQLTDGFRERIARNGAIPGKVVAFDFGDDGVVRIDGAANPPAVTNDDGDSDCRLKMSVADLEDILAGRQNPQMAFMMGKLKVEGDMGLALQLSKLLG